MTAAGRRRGNLGSQSPSGGGRDAKKGDTEQSSVAIYSRDLQRLRHVAGSNNPEKLRELLDYYVPTYNEDEITERWQALYLDALSRDLRIWTMWTLQWSASVKRVYYKTVGPEEKESKSRISRIMAYLSVFDVLEHIKFHYDRFDAGKYVLFVPPFRRPEDSEMGLTESTAFASESVTPPFEVVVFQREKATISHHVGDEFALRMTSSRELIDWLFIPIWKNTASRCVQISDRGSLWKWLVMLEERDVQLHRGSREMFNHLMAALPHFDINEISVPYDSTVRAASHEFFQDYFEAESRLVLKELEDSAAMDGGGVVDFGCGTGNLLGRVGARMGPAGRKGNGSNGGKRVRGGPSFIIGIDHANGMIREAKKKREANAGGWGKHTALLTVDIGDFPKFVKGAEKASHGGDQAEELRGLHSFDYHGTPHFAMLANVLTNVPRRGRLAVLESIFDALNPGDRLLVTAYNADRFEEWSRDVYTHSETLTGPIQIGEFDRPTTTYINPASWFFSHWFSLTELSQLVRDAGFRELRRGPFERLGNFVLCEVPLSAKPT